MPKGLGAMLAVIQMADEKARIDKGLSVACPLCKREMTFNGSAWFCYAEECNPLREKVRNAYIEHYDDVGADESFQGLILAAIFDDNGKMMVEFRTVRGGHAKTNFTVSACSLGDRALVPMLVKSHEWTWQEWMPGLEE